MHTKGVLLKLVFIMLMMQALSALRAEVQITNVDVKFEDNVIQVP